MPPLTQDEQFIRGEIWKKHLAFMVAWQSFIEIHKRHSHIPLGSGCWGATWRVADEINAERGQFRQSNEGGSDERLPEGTRNEPD